MIKLNIHNETAKLKILITGIAHDMGGVPTRDKCFDPKSKEHVIAGTYPTNADCVKEIEALGNIFEKYDVKVFRPQNIYGLNQIFSRDIAFVVDNMLIIPNIIKDREKEIKGIDEVLSQIAKENKIRMPANARAEGGDVMLCNEYIFVGYSENKDFEKYTVARTNRDGLDFLIEMFPDKKVKGFELNKSDENPKENALHLDCCFQPIGKDMAIMYKGGFKNIEDVEFLISYFGSENIIEISNEEMYNMNSNIFAISEDVVISEKGFTRLNENLRKRGFIVEEISYAEIAKMGGLLRCSTMPLVRE
jgi:N-dimethylarginine dimethylaminohydrolase